MSGKRKINKATWTLFWKKLGIIILDKKQKAGPREIYSRDRSRLRGIIERGVVERVIEGFKNYPGPQLQFHRFVTFFLKDTYTVQKWLGATNESEAFKILFNKFHFNKFTGIEKGFKNLFHLYELITKRDEEEYHTKLATRVSVVNIKSRDFSRVLNYRTKTTSYKPLPSFKYADYVVYPIEKSRGGSQQKVYKFVQLSRRGQEVSIKVAADSSDERRKIRRLLIRRFKAPLEFKEIKPDFDKLLEFLKSGESEHFKLVGASFLESGCSVSVLPQFGGFENISTNTVFRRLSANIDAGNISKLTRIWLTHTGKRISISVQSHLNGGILGAVKFNLNGQGLNYFRRAQIKDEFQADFGLELNLALELADISEKDIYKKFLQNTPKRDFDLELRSEKVLFIYKKLLEHKLLPLKAEKEQSSHYCIDGHCTEKFKPVWSNSSVCNRCRNKLYPGPRIVTEAVNEQRVANFVSKISKSLDFSVVFLKRALIKKRIYVCEVRQDSKSVTFIPITTSLNDYQLEIVKLRYPNVTLITSKDDREDLKSQGFEAVSLYEFVFNILETNSKTFIENLINRAVKNRSSVIDSLAKISAARVDNSKFYEDKEKIFRNYGAELFEADCSVILNYIFRNSIWLGASRRGEPLPDGITAFPIREKKFGCFIWDGKFSQGNTPELGSIKKNQKYVSDGKNNITIKNNGGLRGFAFISNKPAPPNFLNKSKKIVGRQWIKVSYLNATNILALYEHFRLNEFDINNSKKIRDVFFDSAEKLFLDISNGKVVILKDNDLQRLLDKNTKTYKRIRPTPVNAPVRRRN